MKLNEFKLENFFVNYEFTAPYLLTQSDCETMSVSEILAMEPGSAEHFLNIRLGYTQKPGDPELRGLIAGLYKTMDASNILICCGAEEGIFAYMNTMLDAGDHMIVMSPGYQSSYEFAKQIPGCSYDNWYVREDGSKWTVDFDELEALIRPNTKLIAVNSPNNPTGFCFTNAEIRRLVAICREHDLYLFADEVYKGLELDGEKREWMADCYEKCVSLGVMSKAYGLPGLRIGWLAAKDSDLLYRMLQYKHFMSICNAAPSEFLSRIIIKHSDEVLEKSRSIIEKNLAYAHPFFERHRDIFLEKDLKAGPVTYHRLLLDMPIQEFTELAVNKKGVLLLPATIYGQTDVPCFRMGYGRKGFELCLDKFEEFLYEQGFAK